MWPKPDISAIEEYRDEVKLPAGVRCSPGDVPAIKAGEGPHATQRPERQRDATAPERP